MGLVRVQLRLEHKRGFSSEYDLEFPTITYVMGLTRLQADKEGNMVNWNFDISDSPDLLERIIYNVVLLKQKMDQN